MGVPSKRFAVFLCLIILHQDLVIARSHYDLEMIAPPRLTSAVDTADEYLPSNQTLTKNELAVSSSSALGRHKRLFGLIIFAVSVVVTAVATTIETIYDIKGCCGLGYDYLCSFEENFKREQKKIRRRAEDVDRRIQEAVKKKDDLECLSKVIEAFWTEVIDLVRLKEEFIKSVSPGLLDSIIRKENKMKNTIRDANRELDESDLEKFSEELEANQLGLKLALGWTSAALPGFGIFGAKAWKAFKFNRLYKTLKATQLETLLKATPKAKELIGFTGGSAKIFIKGVAKTRLVAKTALVTKGMKIVKYGGWFMSLLSIGMDIFNTVSIFMRCDDKVDEAKKAMAELNKPLKKVIDMETKVKEYENVIQAKLVEKVVPEFRKVEFHNALTQVKETIKNLPEGQRTWLTRDCVDTIIPDGLQTFKTSNDYVALKNELKCVIEKCLSPSKYAYECLTSRSKVMSRILDSCRIGAGEFDDIYERAIKKEGTKKKQCIKDGEPYTPEEDYQKSLEDVRKKEGFLIPCRLNSEAFKNDICSRQSGGQTLEKIVTDVGMETHSSKVKKVLEKCKEGADSLPEVQINFVCDGKSFCDLPSDIAKDFEVDYGRPISVEKVKSMPCPAEKKNPKCPTLYN